MKVSWKYFLIGGLIVSVFLAFFVSPFASSYPDGLERVATNHGFIQKGEKNVWDHSPIADYVFPGIKSEFLAKGLAGLVGTLIVFALSYSVLFLVRRGTSDKRKTGSNLKRESE